jgi:hypothetical protein
MSLVEKLELVSDQETFLEFAQALVEDYQKNGSDWENGSIDTFLESALDWVKDSGRISDLSWKTLAEFLYVGKNYE